MARSKVREIEIAALLSSSSPDVVVLTETELPPGRDLSFPGFATLMADPSPATDNTRLAILVRCGIPTAVVSSSHVDLWADLEVSGHKLMVGGLYRQWTTLSEADDLNGIITRAQAIAASNKRVVLLGDSNLDPTRSTDPGYAHRGMVTTFLQSLDDAGFSWNGPHTPTYHSYGTYGDARKESVIDVVFSAGIEVSATTINTSATDHLPVVATADLAVSAAPAASYVLRRKLGAVSSAAMEEAVRRHGIDTALDIDNVNKIHDVIISAITAALDELAPL